MGGPIVRPCGKVACDSRPLYAVPGGSRLGPLRPRRRLCRIRKGVQVTGHRRLRTSGDWCVRTRAAMAVSPVVARAIPSVAEPARAPELDEGQRRDRLLAALMEVGRLATGGTDSPTMLQSAAIETALFRVGQESLGSARKHAQTTRAHMALRRGTRTIQPEVRDWGRGFRPATLAEGSGPSKRVGLLGIRERIALLGGRCAVCSRPGAGTRVVAEVPLPTAAPTRTSRGA